MEFDQVQYRDLTLLLAALSALGYNTVETGEALPLYGYQGDQRRETAEVVVRRKFVGGSSNDLGFRHTENGYVPIISEYDVGHLARKHGERAFVDTLKTEYATAVAAKVKDRLRGRMQVRQDGNLRKITVSW